jgi:hypothetical protein
MADIAVIADTPAPQASSYGAGDIRIRDAAQYSPAAGAGAGADPNADAAPAATRLQSANHTPTPGHGLRPSCSYCRCARDTLSSSKDTSVN